MSDSFAYQNAVERLIIIIIIILSIISNLLLCFYNFKFVAMLYIRLSLSRLRLSRITDYLEEKIWSLFKHINLTSGTCNKILWIRKEIAPQEQFLPFPTIFSIYISN